MLKNTTNQKKLFARLSVVIIALMLSTMGAFAQESVLRTAPSAFSLSAVKEDRNQTKTAFQCPSPLPMQTVPPEPLFQRPSPQASHVNNAAPPVFRGPATPVAPSSPQNLPPQQTTGSQKTGGIEDYSVNWSPWMGVLAHRWFGNLQYAEDASGLRFHTLRPALIQFTCYADGHIGNIVLKQSSGIAYYDRLQVATLLAAVPLPPFPPGSERKSLTLVQGWESHRKEPGDREFEPAAFASRFPQEKVSRWVMSHQQ